MSYKKKPLDSRDSFRINYEDKELINFAAVKGGVDKADIYRNGAIKEAKKILKEIDKLDKEL